jgi:hypothetical protein
VTDRRRRGGRLLAAAGDVDGDRRGDLMLGSGRELVVVTARRLVG